MDEKEAGKKCSLRNKKLKTNRASETEEQWKERHRIRSKVIEKKEKKKVLEEKNWSSETEDH